MRITVLIIAAVVLLWREFFTRRSLLEDEASRLISSLPKNHLEPMEAFASKDPPDKEEYKKAMQKSGGLFGLLRVSRIYVRILQVHRKAGLVKKEHAREVYSWALAQVYFTARGIPEMLFCQAFPKLNPVAGMECVRLHWEIALRTNTLCAVKGAPKCTFDMGDLL